MYKLVSSGLLFLVIMIGASLSFATTMLPVIIEGISDNNRNGVQKDFKEAVLDAKIKAIERAGIAISSQTTVDKGVLYEDIIETQSRGVLLPGYEIIKVGYGEDKAYHIVLVGQIMVKGQEIKLPQQSGITGSPSAQADDSSYSFIVKENSYIKNLQYLRGATIVTDKESFKVIQERVGIRLFLNKLGIYKFKEVDNLDEALVALKYNTADALLSTTANASNLLSERGGVRVLKQ